MSRRTAARRGAPRCLITIGASLLIAVVAAQFQTAVAAETSCPNASMRTGFGANLPDCRAYEQVSPPEKNGGEAQGYPGVLLSSEDGSAVTFYSQLGSQLPGSGGATQEFPAYLSRRGADSWATQRLLPPQSVGGRAGFLGVTPDLRYDVVEAEHLGYLAPGYGLGLFVIDTEDESVEQIVPYEKNELETPYVFDGASKDGSRIFFESEAQITPDAQAGTDNLYVWNRSTKEVTLAGVLPGLAAEAPPAGSFGGAAEWWEGQNLSRGGGRAGLAVAALHAISPSGDQAYFTAAETGQLYLRRGLVAGSPNTVQVSAPNPGVVDANGPKPAFFMEATPDGSHAFFKSAEKLTANATTGPSDEGSDLYRWDEATESLTDITPDDAQAAGAQVQGLLGVSEDGNSGYFVARGALPVQASPGGTAQEGRENVYRFVDADGSVTYMFIGTLSSRAGFSPRLRRSSRVSPDANTLLLSSSDPLTGYNSEGHTELFRYSAPSNRLTCVSCEPAGAAPADASLQSGKVNVYLEPRWTPATVYTRNLSSDGDRVFFETSGQLVPADINGEGCRLEENEGMTPTCQDVYEWEAPNASDPTDSCTLTATAYNAESAGCLFLLTPGQTETPQYFVDASSDGSSAFLISPSQLVASDKDTQYDMYDARVGGGLDAQQESTALSCAGEGCLPAPTVRPGTTSPASATLTGQANVVSEPVRKTTTKPLTRKQKLARALKLCHRKHGTARRACEKAAHKSYGESRAAANKSRVAATGNSTKSEGR